jgi:phasin family protein
MAARHFWVLRKHLREYKMDATNEPPSETISNPGSAHALMRSSHIWALGCQKLGALMATTVHEHLQRTGATWQAMGKATSFTEALDIQAGYARMSARHAMASAKQMAESTNKFTQDAVQPIKQRMRTAWATS